MPRAEVGSTKYLNNKLKQKGLGRLRWYCQVCEKQCRDANGFKMHTQSESHVRQMLIVGEDPKKYINDFSSQFLNDFLQLLKTGHGEKQVHINQFYQEYISNKEHIHMNATKWPSLTEFAKHLGREGICRVEENDKGIHISWIDNSPEALRRQEALRRKEAQMHGDEELEQRMIRDQIKRAQEQANVRGKMRNDDAKYRDLKRQEGEKISLSFGTKPKTTAGDSPTVAAPQEPLDGKEESAASSSSAAARRITTSLSESAVAESQEETKSNGLGTIQLGGKSKTKNVFAQAKKNVLSSGAKKGSKIEQPKKMSEAERIMKQEIERKRSRESAGFGIPPIKRFRKGD